ncbi:hypothetical protein K7X08_016632 [Anisodus acutangulus]|uniref:ATP synthase protein MI25 n=1 Tax=Anisodus acutangulus TaxID=402998 RepID=A0A9Q1R2A3_9SOLA|nr:hypothetical protein K7X08_016632 [Anisodus acutangulus]
MLEGAKSIGAGAATIASVGATIEPSLPATEEEPGDRSEIERALDRLELDRIQEQKDRLAEQISPLIESEKARLVKRLWHRDLRELPSPSEMVEIIIDCFASKAAYNANKPNVPRAHLRHLNTWLTRAQHSAEHDGAGSIWGILLNRQNIPIMSMPIESMLLAVNLNFLVFSVSSDDMMGQLFASLVPTVAAAESAIGLAIFVITFRVRGTIAVESINRIQGSGLFSLGERIRFVSPLLFLNHFLLDSLKDRDQAF